MSGAGPGEECHHDAEWAALLADHSFEGLALSIDGRVIACNKMFCAMIGVGREDAIGMTVADVTTAEGVATVMLKIRRQEEAPYVIDAKRADGSLFKCEVRGKTIKHRGARLRVTSFRDVTKSLRQRKALSRYEHFFNHSSVGFATSTGDAPVFEMVNPALAAMHGYAPEELIGRPVAMLLDDPSLARLAAARTRRSGRVVIEDVSRRKDGSTFPARFNITAVLDADGEVSYRSAAVEDITEKRQQEQERRQLETKMQEAQRLESMGLLAGGIAHDFNNLLVSVLSHADLAQRGLPDASPAVGHLRQIATAARRAADLTSQILTYAGRAGRKQRPIDLSSLARDMIQLLEASVPAHVRLIDETSRRATTVDGDETQLRQVVLNFVTNAADSMASKPGTILVRSDVFDVDATTRRDSAWQGDLSLGPHVRLEIVDDGCGMDGDTKTRMFDPFFSTKESGRGLGLAAVLGILKTHRAAVRVDSRPDAGTTVTVAFPASQHASSGVAEERAQRRPWAGSGTMLVVDDMPNVRSAAAALLTSLGFDVITAADGREGLELFEQRRDDIVAVLLDASMPNMDGPAMLAALDARGRHPPVILTSGFIDKSFDDIGSVAAFLPKPFGYDALIECLQRVLGDGPQ